MPTLSVPLSSLYSHTNRFLFTRTLSSHQSRGFPQCSPLRLHHQQFGSLDYNPRREKNWAKLSRTGRIGRANGAVRYSAALTPANLQWVAAVSTGALMLTRGTVIRKSFLVPLFALQAPASIVSWMKGEYGMWTAFLTLIVRLFFFIPGELELPFITLMLVIASPHRIMKLRGTKEGGIVSVIMAAYLGYEHFTRTAGFRKAFDQRSILASLATISILAMPCILLLI